MAGTPYRIAGWLMLLTAALLAATAALDWAGQGWLRSVLAGLWIGLAAGLFRGMRWCAYLGFLAAVFGLSVALAGALQGADPVAGLLWLAVLGKGLTAAVLFALLWQGRPAAVPPRRAR